MDQATPPRPTPPRPTPPRSCPGPRTPVVLPELAGRPATCCVYLLACGPGGDLYCGWTTDLGRRLASHRAGRGSRYVASRLPAEPVCVVPCATRTEARSLEARIKRLDRRAKLRLVATVGLDAAPPAAAAR